MTHNVAMNNGLAKAGWKKCHMVALAVREGVKVTETACLTHVTGCDPFFFFFFFLQPSWYYRSPASFYFNTDCVLFVFVEFFSLVEDWFSELVWQMRVERFVSCLEEF